MGQSFFPFLQTANVAIFLLVEKCYNGLHLMHPIRFYLTDMSCSGWIELLLDLINNTTNKTPDLVCSHCSFHVAV